MGHSQLETGSLLFSVEWNDLGNGLLAGPERAKEISRGQAAGAAPGMASLSAQNDFRLVSEHHAYKK
jgi:hypothetical protein